jgi:ATP-dependent Clp protease ATP-binding subunit ClpB
LLKPALARGELHAIGATTLKEYQKYIEKDKALERRFQAVMVEEPDVADAISILRGIKDKYELHHGVRIQDDAVIAAVELSNRYISDRFLPDKAIDLMDEAAAKMRLEIDSVPEEIDDIQRKIMQLEIEREAIRRENNKEKETILTRDLADLSEKRDALKANQRNQS